MIGTARGVARSLKIAPVSPEMLMDPDLNIRLGAHLLAGLMHQFHGNKAYALASYNGGPLSVNRWRADRPGLELDEWVEEIPYSETRGYVKRVLRTYNTYQLLYAKSAPVKTLSSSK